MLGRTSRCLTVFSCAQSQPCPSPSQTQPGPGLRSLGRGPGSPWRGAGASLQEPAAVLVGLCLHKPVPLLEFPQGGRETGQARRGQRSPGVRSGPAALRAVLTREVDGEGLVCIHASTAPWLAVCLIFSSPACGAKWGHCPLRAPLPHTLPRGSCALPDFHLPPHRAPHCSASQTDGQEWEPALGGRQTQGGRGAGRRGPEAGPGQAAEGLCEPRGSRLPSPGLSHLHVQTAGATGPEPSLRMSERERPGLWEGDGQSSRPESPPEGEHARVCSCGEQQPVWFPRRSCMFIPVKCKSFHRWQTASDTLGLPRGLASSKAPACMRAVGGDAIGQGHPTWHPRASSTQGPAGDHRGLPMCPPSALEPQRFSTLSSPPALAHPQHPCLCCSETREAPFAISAPTTCPCQATPR